MKTKFCTLIATVSLLASVSYAQPVVTYPSGGETLNAGSTVTITWTGTSLNTIVGIDYTIDNWTNTTWLTTNFQNPSANSYTWVVPNTPGTQCKVGVFNTSFQGDISDNFFTISTTTGVEENFTANDISVYPNPFYWETTLHSDKVLSDATLTVYNLSGQQVRQIKYISGHTISLFRDNLPSGLYFVCLTEENNTFKVDKLVIINK
ncbi:MAG: T9SS type A sorting domain-containing protein [Bacteroidales bacterium]|nr:T9SS type A sorting domain-containing protein [Bacteroidales bacterium]MCF8455839.1 T9SS type A sorting domain-containing protein [Bacteroidales bacterium]